MMVPACVYPMGIITSQHGEKGVVIVGDVKVRHRLDR
jgi:hypothetical protein